MASRTDIQNEEQELIAQESIKSTVKKLKPLEKQLVKSHDVKTYVRNLKASLKIELASAQLAAYLVASNRVLTDTGKEPIALSLDPVISKLAKQLLLDHKRVNLLRAKFGQDAVDVIRGVGDYVNTELRVVIADAVKANLTVAETSAALTERLRLVGTGHVNPHLIETITRTQLNMAYSSGRWQMMQDPVIDELIWGYEYIAVRDSRARESHLAHDGVRLPKNHPFWKKWWPPNGFRCRCTILEIFKDDTANARVTPVPKGIKPDDGFNFNPGEVAQYSPAVKVKDNADNS